MKSIHNLVRRFRSFAMHSTSTIITVSDITPDSFCIVNLGCKVNRVEGDAIMAALLKRGAKPVDQECADLIVINTCTVTGEADKKARKACRHALAANPCARVVVTGCATAVNPDAFSSLDPRICVVDRLDLALAFDAGSADHLRTGEGFRTRVNIKIQDGCDHACTYCIVHVARGKARSMPADDVIAEARKYFESGIKEVVLTGIDIGSYQSGNYRIAKLAENLIEVADHVCVTDENPARIRISSIEPLNVTDDLIELLRSADGRLCRHLQLPLQSGSSKVLKEMDRPYTAEQYAELVSKLRDAVPSISLSTDIIVGFPGETEEDFVKTCELARVAGFSRIHVFPYSMREGTPAAKRSDQIAPEEKRNRARMLRELGAELSREDLAKRAGTIELAIVEGASALTESYHELAAPEGSSAGELVPVQFPSIDQCRMRVR